MGSSLFLFSIDSVLMVFYIPRKSLPTKGLMLDYSIKGWLSTGSGAMHLPLEVIPQRSLSMEGVREEVALPAR